MISIMVGSVSVGRRLQCSDRVEIGEILLITLKICSFL